MRRTPTPALIALLLASSVLLSACETVKGAGQDLENAGEAISAEAAETQQQM